MISSQLKGIIASAPCDYHDENHTYTAKEGGKLWPGVTSITDNLNKPFLVPWAAKECAEAVKAHKAKLRSAETDAAFDMIVDACKITHRTKSKDAAESGTLAHEWIERYIGYSVSRSFPEQYPYPDDPKASAAVQAFVEWLENNSVGWLASELVVGSIEHEFGGTLDAIAILNGIPTLIDFKTSNQISKDYFLQTAAYQIALEEMGVRVWQRMILRIPKDGAGFETLIVPTPFDLDRATFLGLRQTQRWQSYIGNGDNKILDANGRVRVDQKVEQKEVA